MIKKLYEDAKTIIDGALRSVLPDKAVKSALKNFGQGLGYPQNSDYPRVQPVERSVRDGYPQGRLICIGIGKAAWQMTKAASEKVKIDEGIVITKYNHVKGKIENVRCYEGSHPVPDENCFKATLEAEKLVANLTKDDVVLFLISGGGSALFEDPLVPPEVLKRITRQLLESGADINEINVIRKHLSNVKGGRFAKMCEPAKIFSIVLSDVIGDDPATIASGPAYPDSSTSEEAISILKKYNIKIDDDTLSHLKKETPKTLGNVQTQITGSVSELCTSAAEICKTLGYAPIILTNRLVCTARDAGSFLASILQTHALDKVLQTHALDKGSAFCGINAIKGLAFIAGGETIVKVTGKGKGGRNQEIALSAAKQIAGLNGAVFSVGSDGTDGPTNAAGGYVDGDSYQALLEKSINVDKILSDNDSYRALEEIGGLIITGPTGTNVNDVAVALLAF